MIATCAAPNAATIAANTAPAIGPAVAYAFIIANEVAIVVWTIEFALSHLACFSCNAAFFFSSSAFLAAVLSSAARLRASASSVEIAPFSSRASIRSISLSYASSLASCSFSTFSIRASYISVISEVMPDTIFPTASAMFSKLNFPSSATSTIISDNPSNIPAVSPSASLAAEFIPDKPSLNLSIHSSRFLVASS